MKVLRLSLVMFVLSFPACKDVAVPVGENERTPAAPRLTTTPSFRGRFPNLTPIEVYDEITTPDVGIWAPDDEVIGRTCPLVIYREITGTIPIGGGEMPRFGFRGTKPRLGYVAVAGLYPAAQYRHPFDEFSDDARWIATAGGSITIAGCRGRSFRLPGARVWVGTYWMHSYDGEIRAGPNYQGGGGSGNGDADCDDLPMDNAAYDPYDPDGVGGPSCEMGGGGAGSTPGTGAPCGGGPVYYDTLCVEVWNGERWVEWWCGVVTFCL